MYRKLSLLSILIFAIFILGACGGPSQDISAGDVLLSETFDDVNAWENFEFDSVSLAVSGGAYQMVSSGDGFTWGLNETEHTDVVMEATAVQNSTYENNAYGVMCRADVSNNGDGYYFLVSGDGFYSISKGEGDDVNPIVDWTSSSAIEQGQATNKIKAVCSGNYLSLHVNDRFVAEVEDTTYTSGYAGFAAATFEGGDVDISFDNLTISTATAASE